MRDDRADQRRNNYCQRSDPGQEILVNSQPQDGSEQAADYRHDAPWPAHDARRLNDRKIQVGVAGGPKRYAHSDDAQHGDPTGLFEKVGSEIAIAAINDASQCAHDLQEPLRDDQHDEGNGDCHPGALGESRVFRHHHRTHDPGADDRVNAAQNAQRVLGVGGLVGGQGKEGIPAAGLSHVQIDRIQTDCHQNDHGGHADPFESLDAKVSGCGKQDARKQGNRVELRRIKILSPGKPERTHYDALPADGQEGNEQHREIGADSAIYQSIQQAAVAGGLVAHVADYRADREVGQIAVEGSLHRIRPEAHSLAQGAARKQSGNQKAPSERQRQQRQRITALAVAERRQWVVGA